MSTNEALAKLPARKPGATATYLDENPAAAIASIERSMGGRQDLIDAILAAPVSPELDYVIGMIADPRNDARRLANICADGRITIGELIEAYKRGVIAAAQVAAVHHVAANLPGVIEDVMVRARPHLVECASCRGEGVLSDPEFVPDRAAGQTRLDAPSIPCAFCKGTGQRVELPDLDRQKFAAELGGLGPKKAPIVDMSDRRKLSINDSSAAGFVDLLGAVDQFLYRRGGPTTPTDSSDTIDAEPIPDDTTPGPDPTSGPLD